MPGSKHFLVCRLCKEERKDELLTAAKRAPDDGATDALPFLFGVARATPGAQQEADAGERAEHDSEEQEEQVQEQEQEQEQEEQQEQEVQEEQEQEQEAAAAAPTQQTPPATRRQVRSSVAVVVTPHTNLNFV